jgi:hypothetical protein
MAASESAMGTLEWEDGTSAAGAAATSTEPPGDSLALRLEDLIPDARGEVVILSPEECDITVLTSQAVAQQGTEPSHVTSVGLDVSGFSFCTFDGGVTVFYPGTHRLVVMDEG